MSRIDADRLTLPLNLLDKVASILPMCTGEVDDPTASEGNYRDLQNAIRLLNMALTELHRLQDQAMEDQP